MQVYFIGAGPGDPELLTLKGARILGGADVVIYAGSLVNPVILARARTGAAIYDSAGMDLEQIVTLMESAVRSGRTVARLHTGDPSLYGAIREQMDALDARGIPYEVIPGVSSFVAAAAALGREFTVPGGSQTLIITRVAGKTPVPASEDLAALAAHRASLCLFLSAGLAGEAARSLLAAYPPDTPVAIVEKASWPEERIVAGRLGDLEPLVAGAGITRTALILVGDFLTAAGARSRLYDRAFAHGYRPAPGDAR